VKGGLIMLTQGFYYFLFIGELAILGMIIVGIYIKVKRVLTMSAGGSDDKNSEHHVSESDQIVEAGDGNLKYGAIKMPSPAEKIRSGQTFMASDS
jgi:hypothetical protein